MGTDEALNRGMEEGAGQEKRSLEAVVVELLPSATYRVELSDRRQMLAHLASTQVRNFVRLRVGDRVQVEPSLEDGTRGRIIELLKKR
ncbi:MAG: translation initiation factor IF-1 [Bryobacterales bacterium]|nr:translation initiation factor IF-1 [Bryobacterales bacterium]MEB2363509.1 translation initiation factor IF-1 [Bryobacterales bacterium]